MIALIDIGNSRTKYCVVSQGKRGSVQSFANELLSNEYLSQCFNRINKLIVASVSHNKLTDKIELWCHEQNIDYQQVVSEKSKNGVCSAYHQPSQLGVDRWLTLIAAKALYPSKNTLIVDAGTATTIDLIASNGAHQGGWILAGIETLFSCVQENTSQVKAKVVKTASLSFGLNSSENVNNATWAATVGAINLAVTQSEQQGVVIDEILLTGGNGGALASLLSHQCKVIEDLVFIGLQAYI
ncbi:type III pantothenate kinase [Candidatus Colwellia aromaticivorans]|uniref:type III pantothenate kinase n=1 Tax=Candidatus Colwellia aromaticivorans TaxID=2267621 RepID=UPI000DF1E623|nr:type III pantothenate kinase [Candidatus Colwellia aromaticivorans]